MLRLIVRLIIAAAIAFGLVIVSYAMTALPSDHANQETAGRILNYEAEFDLDASGRMEVVETMTWYLPNNRGIFMFFDHEDTVLGQARHNPIDLNILQNGQPTDLTINTRYQGRMTEARTGEENTWLRPGEYVFEVSYVIEDAMRPADVGLDREFQYTSGALDPTANSAFYWDVIPLGWTVPIDDVHVTVRLPDEALSVQCAGGTFGQVDCVIDGVGERVLTLTANGLNRNEAITLRAEMGIPAPSIDGPAWSIRFDPLLGQSYALLAILLVLSVPAFSIGAAWAFSSREREPGFPVMYAPPANFGPVEAHYVAEESPGKDALTATLFYAADHKLIRLEALSKDDWDIIGIADPSQWEGTDSVTQAVGRILGVNRKDGVFKARKTEESGKVLQEAQQAIGPAVREWARDEDLVQTSTAERAGQVAVVAAFILAVLLVVFARPMVFSLPFFTFVVGGVTLLAPGVGTRRTTAGREAWSRIGGFRRLLTTDSAEDRFDFAARKDLYIAYVPYAVAFGAADTWAEKYRANVGQEPPRLPYVTGRGGSAAAFATPAIAASAFTVSVTSAVGAYTAAQSSSSGGGSFGGGGGGGGGRGGGSW